MRSIVCLVVLALAVPLCAASLSLPGSVSAEATGPAGAIVTYSVLASSDGSADDVNGRPLDGPAGVDCHPASGSRFSLGTTTVQCSATDSNGSATGSFQVIVTDTTAPTLHLPGDFTVPASSNQGAAVSFTVNGTDIVDGVRGASCTPGPGVFPVGTTLVNCTTSDFSGNQSSGSFSVTVTAPAPPPPPEIDVPDDMTVEATSAAGAQVSFSASGQNGGDDENGRPNDPVSVSCSPASGSTFPIGVTTVQCTATDSGGSSSESFTITVVDTTAPALNLPQSFTVAGTSNSGATVSYSASATDLVDGDVSVTCSPASGSTFPVGTTPVSCTASDSRGNTANGGFSVTVTEPPAPAPPPEIDVPEDMTVEATSAAGAQVSFSASGRNGGMGDDENGRPNDPVTVSCSPASGSTFPLGVTTVQCTATDSGGSTSDSFTVTVVDTTAPALDLPRSFTVGGTSDNGSVVNYTASANDLVDGDVSVTCSPASGSTFPVGTTSVTCSASDSRGNTANGGFDVTVTPPDVPPPPPTLDLPDDITAEADGPSGAMVTFVVTTTGGNGDDDENGRPTTAGVTCAPASGSLFPLGTTTVQCSAGSVSGSFLIHVVDTTAPVLTLPDDITTAQSTVTYTATATDLVDGSVTVTCTPPSGSTFSAGTTTVNCSAADTRGNTANGSFTVTVTQTTQRTITVTASPSSLWPPDHKMVAVTINVTISDNSAFTAQIVGVSSDDNDPNDNTSPDWVVTGPLTLNLRAEKSNGKARTYTIDVEVIDDANVSHLHHVLVTVDDGATKAPNTTRMRNRKG